MDEQGTVYAPPAEGAWANVLFDGTPAAPDCQGWTTNAGFPEQGRYGGENVTTGWTNQGTRACHLAHRFYCFQQ